jgi:hypothetical protein
LAKRYGGMVGSLMRWLAPVDLGSFNTGLSGAEGLTGLNMEDFRANQGRAARVICWQGVI